MKLCIAFLAALAFAGPVSAHQLLLTVSGPLGTKSYDLPALEALGAVSFTTSTIWTEGSSEFTGIPLLSILGDAGIVDGDVVATAANDYAIEIPISEITETYPIVAYLIDGSRMTVRDKGPLWVVYPYDSDPALSSEVVYARSIWQLDRLSARP